MRMEADPGERGEGKALYLGGDFSSSDGCIELVSAGNCLNVIAALTCRLLGHIGEAAIPNL